jgi:hypothetical protein
MRNVNVILVGGPYEGHICIIRPPLPIELRFPAEPLRNIHGKLSVCAPKPQFNGPYLYRRAGRDAAIGDPRYEFSPLDSREQQQS